VVNVASDPPTETATELHRGTDGDGDGLATDPRSRLDWMDRRLLGVCATSVVVVLASLLVQVSFGSYQMSLGQAWFSVFDADVWYHPATLASFLLGDGLTRTVFGLDAAWEPHELVTATNVVWNVRIPRVAVAAFVGANLAVSGVIFQALTRNELASPFVLGVSSGAGLAVLLSLVVFTVSTAFLPLFAALGGTLAFLLVYAISWEGGTSPVRLVLAGVVVSTVFQSLQTAVFLLAQDVGTVQTAIVWLTGSLTGKDWEQVRVVAPWTLAVVVPGSLLAAKQLNVLALGERTAASLGMRVERVRFGLSAIAIVAAAASIAVAGVVSFVGLVVPHLVRSVVGHDHRRLVVGSLFAGAALVVAADVGARLGVQFATGGSGQLPVGILTGLIGGPYFLYRMRVSDGVGGLR